MLQKFPASVLDIVDKLMEQITIKITTTKRHYND